MIPRSETKWIVVHATLTADHPTVREIEWRARSYGYLDVGMHYVVSADGNVTTCRPVALIGTGCRPHNGTAVSVLMTGSPPFTEAQLDALATLLKGLQLLYPEAAIAGYRDLPGVRNTESPGFNATEWWGSL